MSSLYPPDGVYRVCTGRVRQEADSIRSGDTGLMCDCRIIKPDGTEDILTCRVGYFRTADGTCFYLPVFQGCQGLILLPGTGYDDNPVFLPVIPVKAEATDDDIKNKSGEIWIKGGDGVTINVKSADKINVVAPKINVVAPDIRLEKNNEGAGAGAARIGDKIKLSVIPADILTLATALLTTGMFTPSGLTPPLTPTPWETPLESGQIITGSDITKVE